MSKIISRLRMFAGPNGSGKSTIKSVISQELLGIYINPDEIEFEFSQKGFLDFSLFGVKIHYKEVFDYLIGSNLIRNANLLEQVQRLSITDTKLFFSEIAINSYFASALAAFIRHKLIEKRASFTFETVMSSPDKVELLRNAQEIGYRTYLYYVATKDPAINISRISNRVDMGGHSVPEEKTKSRYKRSLDLLRDAVRFTNRAYIFDNSGHEHILLAEITEGKILEMKTSLMPEWFKKSLWDKICEEN